MTPRLRIGVVGASVGGASAAILLSREGHHVDLVDRPLSQRPAGAGIVLQQLGQQVLDRIGVLAPLRAVSAPIHRVEALTRQGRPVLSFAYDEVVPGAQGLGVHRGRMLELLDQAVAESEVNQVSGTVTGRSPVGNGTWLLHLANTPDPMGPFDLIVGADGSNSSLRRASGLTRRNRPYEWGAVWSLVSDPEGVTAGVLGQRYDGTRVTLGCVPAGMDQAMVFWSAHSSVIDQLVSDDELFSAAAMPHAGSFMSLVERAASGTRLAARYFDVRVHQPHAPGLVLIGDAAHATSPQLGTGASLALADAWNLTAMLRRHAGLAAALDAHARVRRQHVAYYQWASRMMTPMFQSNLTPLGWVRDRTADRASQIPWVRNQMVTTLMGVRTSPWGHWELPE